MIFRTIIPLIVGKSILLAGNPPPDVIPMPPKTVPVAKEGIGGLAGDTIDIIFSIAGAVGFVVILVLGYQMLTTKGKPEEFKKAALGLVNMAIGFIILTIAYAVVKSLMTINF